MSKPLISRKLTLAGDNLGTTSDSEGATVGGGAFNTASGAYSTIAGGRVNTADGSRGTVGGGESNHANGDYATVPGGSYNEATGYLSFAAGYRAKASHQGAFVWADYTMEDFLSTTNNGFRVRASGGVEYVAGQGGWRIEPHPTSPNIIGGHSDNTVGSGVYGGTIAGGGYSAFGNHANDNYCTVGGGADNYTGDGGTTGGGQYATIGGGFSNRAYGSYSTIGGGSSNHATGNAAAVSGGSSNYATGNYVTVPGGNDNEAVGNYSFAAGRHAKASTTGSFVWADSSDFDFSAPAANSFKVRATGGVRIVVGIDGTGAYTNNCLLNDGTGWTCSSDRNLKENLIPIDGKEVLDRLVKLPVYKWNAKGFNPAAPHLGPMAQDFYAAFGLG